MAHRFPNSIIAAFTGILSLIAGLWMYLAPMDTCPMCHSIANVSEDWVLHATWPIKHPHNKCSHPELIPGA